MKDLRGKTALVTGGASGIGRCIALALAREGCNVAVVDIDEASLRAVAAEVESAGVLCTTHLVDVSDEDQVEALPRKVRPQLLVNCAGVGILAALENTTAEDWNRILGIDLLGPINLVRAFLPALKSGGDGHVVNIASGLGLFGFPGFGAYSTSKFALVGYSEVLSVELAKYGIGVTTVCPGVTATAILGPPDAGEHQRTDRFARRLLPLIGTNPERLSLVVVDAIKRDKRLVVHTWPFRLLFLFKRLSPALFNGFVSILYGAAMKLKRDAPQPAAPSPGGHGPA